jgi:hypothetical protein
MPLIAKATQAAGSKMFEILLLPPQSPDLNVLENVWGFIKRKLPHR